MMVDENTRLQQIPVMHVRGTHYMCGFSVGRQFGSVIGNLVNSWDYMKNVLVPAYESAQGKGIYDQSLGLCKKKFPMYVKELEGMAEGARVPFYKLFLLHIDTIIAPNCDDVYGAKRGNTGCTTIMSNTDKVILGHTEDAFPEFLNNVYVISAEILNDAGDRVEKFAALTYAGNLPGYSMGFNVHGLVYSINSVFPKDTLADRTPKMFLTRALLGTSNLSEALELLRDTGSGSSDGFSVNVTFAKQEGSPVMHNIEVGPPSGSDKINESELSVLTLTHGDFHVHCNKYLRLKLTEGCELAVESSNHRHKRIARYLRPNTDERIMEILSDQSDTEYPVFRLGAKQPDYVKTVAVGMFDITNRKWYLYVDPPHTSAPVAILNMDF